MSKYFCYAKNDKNKEPIYTMDASSLYTAIQHFSELKRLEPGKLLEIYSIERIKENT